MKQIKEFGKDFFSEALMLSRNNFIEKEIIWVSVGSAAFAVGKGVKDNMKWDL